jgi:CheY-like chemotaxis protein
MQHTADSPLFTTRVAVVEGDRPTAEMLHTFFRLMELECTLVNPDSAAIDTIRRLAPTVVLLDFDLPDLRALEMAREIRASCPGIVVIFATAADPPAPTTAEALVVRKPKQRFEELLSLLEVVLEFS